MCGIAGIMRWEGLRRGEREVERMTAAVAHRGPDGVGLFQRDGVALGHRRLAIIDPELGQQPMASADETIWLTYNGEMYNYLDLKEELRQKGHRFVTNSDTEVAIHAYQEWGTDCVRKFRGMFAFALADFRNRKLFLARDHFGIKPLYYRVGDGYLAFASELSALRQVDDVAPAGSLQGIDLYMRFGYIPTPHTIYRDVYKLPPASFISVDFDGRRTEPTRYWDVRFESKDELSDQAWLEHAEATIRDSVKAHLVADVPFGVFLSGGIDSTLVAWQMSQILSTPVQAFAIGFSEKEHSELEYAELAAKRCGIELHTQIIHDDALEILPDLVSHYGEPFGDSSAIPTWYVSRLARERVPMVLSGDGGDEGFAGYWSYHHWMEAEPRAAAMRLMRSAVESARQLAPRASFYWLRKSLRKFISRENYLTAWQDIMYGVNAHGLPALWHPEYQEFIGHRCEIFEQADKKALAHDRLAYAQYLDFQTYLPCDILTKVDVASMYHGLEVRTPLVDLRVVELAARLPLNQRMRRNGSSVPARKYLLKKILGKTFPQEFIHRKKQGFGIPTKSWFMPGHSARKLLEEVLVDRGSRLYEFFDSKQIRAQVDIHGPKYDNSNALWLLLVLGLWLEQNREISFG